MGSRVTSRLTKREKHAIQRDKSGENGKDIVLAMCTARIRLFTARQHHQQAQARRVVIFRCAWQIAEPVEVAHRQVAHRQQTALHIVSRGVTAQHINPGRRRQAGIVTPVQLERHQRRGFGVIPVQIQRDTNGVVTETRRPGRRRRHRAIRVQRRPVRRQPDLTETHFSDQ
nr:hypothetical 20K protein (celY region) - Erwinia chrysanthemi [Dickeya chrysanthemi]